MRTALTLALILMLIVVLGSTPVLALDPSLDISQYGHTAWTVQDGFSVGTIFAMAQTPDGYLWLGSEFGLFRFDGIHAVPWQPPAGQLPQRPYALLVTRDGTLWIGTFRGLASWDGRKLTQYPEIGPRFVTSLLEDHEGTVWAGVLYQTPGAPNGQVCAIRNGTVQCYLNGGAFGSYVWSLAEDRSGTLWAGAESGLWRWNPSSPKRYPTSARVGDMATSDDGQVVFGISGGGLRRLVADRLESFPIRSAINGNALLPDREVDSNKLLRDRDGGLWIGTHQHGLIHVHNGRTDVFTTSDGLSGDISCSLFEDREGNVWYGSTRGLDRFRELGVTSISTKQGLSSDAVQSLVAGKDGTMWVATRDGLTRLRNGQTTIFRKENGLPDNFVQSLYDDSRGRLWASFPAHRLSFFENGKFVGVSGLPSEEVYSITGDEKDNLWLCGTKGLSHLRGGRLVETVPWSVMGRHQQAKVIAADRGGIWLAFWIERSLLFFKDGRVQESYTSFDGLGKDEVEVVDLRLDQDGALWVATHYSGIIRIKDGHIATLTTKNGVPSDTILSSIEDNDRSVWLYTASGLVRISRSELDAWIADPNRTIQMSVWKAADGVVIRETAPSYYSPSVAKSSDGKLWFNTGDGVQLVDPPHLAFNKLPPPVHIEGIVADHKVLWQNLPGTAVSNLRLPARTRDLQIDYTALSLVAPEKVHFKYLLEGQDQDWKEVVNERQAKYTNLRPRHYRFRVIASNNSGVWNERGALLEFSVAPAYYQTTWFRALCAAGIIAVFWAFYLSRVRRLHHEFEMTLDARVGERTRIARDLHDTLLQSFHGILLHLQILSNELPGDTTKARLQSIIDQAEHAIVEGRDAVKGLRTSAEERNNLALAIRTLGEELGASNSRRPDFTVQVEGAPRNLHPIVRDEVYRIAGEAMRNAFRHANAQRIEVEIHYDEGEFRVRVRDNGKGIDRKLIGEDGREGHFGLRGMRERAKLLGGKLTVWSELDSGTEVELSLAAAHAYLAALERRRSGLVEKLAGRFGRKDS
jgi:signal transduction histidine kinase/ligand-binding sensor domain-containing protein